MLGQGHYLIRLLRYHCAYECNYPHESSENVDMFGELAASRMLEGFGTSASISYRNTKTGRQQ